MNLKSYSLLAVLIALSPLAQSATFDEFLKGSCGVKVRGSSHMEVMLKTGICVGYFSGIRDLLISQKVICNAEKVQADVLSELGRKMVNDNPEIGSLPAHTGVATVLSANFLCADGGG